MASTINGTLPPCRICGGRASGYHYGANTCEACKAFFRRGVDRAHVYVCADNECCEISYRRRGSCAYCRYQKCLKMGMDMDASKPGRYTHEKRAENIKEVKELLAKMRKDSQPDSSQTTSNHSTSTSTQSDKESSFSEGQTSESHTSEGHASEGRTSEGHTSEGQTSQGHASTAGESDIVASFNSKKQIKTNYNISINETFSIPSSDYSSNSLLSNESVTQAEDRIQNSHTDTSGVMIRYDLTKVELYENVIQEMNAMHRIFSMEDAELGTQLSTKENECLEMVELKKQIFGKLDPMTPEEFYDFYKETGIDIDGRLEIAMDCMPMVEQSMKNHIAFAKTIPGFNQLSLNDQINLIKKGRYDSSIISRHRRFNPKYKLYSPYKGRILHMQDLLKIKGEFAVNMFKMEEKIHNLDLQKEETTILSAICLMSADNCELEDRELVERNQDFLVECLFYLFDKYHPADRLRFPKIIDCLTELRSLRHDNQKMEGKLKQLWATILDVPPLVSELWGAAPT